MIKLSKEIIFISAPLCAKCIRIKRWLKEVKENHPEIEITKLNIAFKAKEVKKYNIKTIPTVIVGKTMLGGWIKEEEFKAALEKM